MGRPHRRVAAGGRDLYLDGERGAGERGGRRSDRYRSMVPALERGRATAGGAAAARATTNRVCAPGGRIRTPSPSGREMNGEGGTRYAATPEPPK